MFHNKEKKCKIKKILPIMILCFFFSLSACSGKEETTEETTVKENLTAEAEGVMSYEDFQKKDIGALVVMDVSLKEKISWNDYKAVLNAEDAVGTYSLENVTCSKEDYEKLSIGTKIRIIGYKAEEQGRIITDVSFEELE